MAPGCLADRGLCYRNELTGDRYCYKTVFVAKGLNFLRHDLEWKAIQYLKMETVFEVS